MDTITPPFKIVSKYDCYRCINSKSSDVLITPLCRICINYLMKHNIRIPIIDKLVYYIQANDILGVKNIINEKADVNCIIENKFTPLLLTINYNDDNKIMKFLIEQKADVDKNYYNNTPLISCSNKYDLNGIKLLLDYKADPNIIITSNINTVLLNSINEFNSYEYESNYENQFDIIKILVDHNADVNIKGYNGFTPLMLLSYNKNKYTYENDIDHLKYFNYVDKIQNYLIDNNADIESVNNMGQTVIDMCSNYSSSCSLVQRLLVQRYERGIILKNLLESVISKDVLSIVISYLNVQDLNYNIHIKK